MKRRLLRRLSLRTAFASSLAMLAGLASSASCTTQKDVDFGTQTFRIDVVGVDDSEPPTLDSPLPANTGALEETWDVDIQAVDATGNPANDFDGVVRLSVEPGAVVRAINADGEDLGRNLRLKGGK
ncbi:MAG TPA: hypothetical protein VL400_14240, partial [Polyangiaceae bacterium]|nr:hypothetical protein [Polyangiaceae bacterium]